MKVIVPTAVPVSMFTLGLAIASPVQAQTPPDAGLIYQETRQEMLSPKPSSVEIRMQGQPLTERDPGGAQVTIRDIRFQGNEAFASDTLLAALGEDALEKSYDLAGLQALANRISEFYRVHGYTFARAVLPPQALDEGILQIAVIEGRYGEVAATGKAELAGTVQQFLHPLAPGDLIHSDRLERTLLIAGDLPGIRLTPVMRPGQAYGTGDLVVAVEEDRRVSARLSVDNHGSRFSGQYRGRADLLANRLLTTGDALTVSALYSSEDTWLGQLGYSLPLGYSGLRGRIGYDHTDYTLGEGFEGYTGMAKVWSAGLSYPLVRRQQSNLSLSVTYQHKDLDDDADFIGYNKAARSQSLPIALQFDHRDSLLGGGITYGAVSLTPGELEIDQTASADNDYAFTKVNLDLARLQAVTRNLSLYGRFNGQWSDRRKLDGSESFYLGGPSGVRAFPVGEGSDSRGWLSQLELRYHLRNGLSPYLLMDHGHTPNGDIDDEQRDISGAGFGVRLDHKAWSADLVSAWKLDGGDANADGRQRNPRFWFNLSYRL